MRWQSLRMKAGWMMRGTIFHIRWFPVHSHFSDVVYTERGRSSDRGSDLPRAKPLEQRMMGM